MTRARLALVVAFSAAAATFAVPAHAIVCGQEIESVCETVCKVDRALGKGCPR